MLKHLATVLFALSMSAAQAQGWVDVTPATPGPAASRGQSAMCYDPIRAVTWLMEAGTYVDFYAWDGSSWTPVPSGSAITGSVEEAVWDAAGGRVVIRRSASFWAWDGTTVTSLPSLPSSGAMLMAYDSVRAELVVLVDVGPAMQTWTFDGVGWTQASPSVLPDDDLGVHTASMFFDPARERVVKTSDFIPPLFWEWTGSNWVQQFPMPSHDELGQVASAAPRGFAFSQQFSVNAGGPRAFTVANGEFDELFLTSWPAMRIRTHLVYDSGRDRFVLHGGQSPYGGTPSAFSDTWELDLGDTATYTTFGAGCAGTYGTPTLSPAGDLPSVNTTFTLQVSGLPWTGPVFMWLGFSNQFYGSVPLPANLAILGAPQCDVLISPDVLYTMPNVLGTSLWQFGVPNLPGAVFYNQAVAFDPGANGLGLIFSNGGEAIIGQ